jgi:chromosomal replication initiation ATPase DnaA
MQKINKMPLNVSAKNEEYCIEVIELFSIMGDAIRKIGFVNLKQYIYRMSENANHPLKKELELKILKWVSEETSIAVDDIVNSNKRGDTYVAKKIVFVLFKNELGLSEYKVAKYFSRTPPIVGRAKKEFELLDEKIKNDKKILDIYNNVSEKILKFKKETDYNKIIKQ